jgi:REP element-mobilizing transposase RayT
MTFKPHQDPTHLYFVTATVLGWRQIFLESAYARIVLDSLAWHRRHDRWSLFAYVLMPNHLHAVIKPRETQTISSVLQSFGSFTAHAILARLENEDRHELLRFFAARQDKDRGKQHQIWQPIQPKNIYSVPFLREKLEYTHNNPVAKHWRLVEDRAQYGYSSACFYDRGLEPIVQVDDVREWLV